MQLSRTHLAILISLIGSGSLACRSAVAQDEASLRQETTRVESSESTESAIRTVLGLSTTSAANSPDDMSKRPIAASTVAAPKAAAPQWDKGALGLASPALPDVGVAHVRETAVRRSDDATDETHVRWTLAISPPAVEQAPASRALPVSPHSKPLIATAHVAPQAAPALADDRPAIDQPVDERTGVDRPGVDETVLVDRAEPSHLVSSSDSDALDGPATWLLSTPGTVPRPRRRGDHPPPAVIADTPSANSRRVNLHASTTLSLPPDRNGIDPFESHRHPRLAKRAGASSKDPLLSLLQVLDDRDVRAPYREPLSGTVATAVNANEARIASDVFERIAFEVERLAAAPAPAPAAEESLAVADIVDTIAASEALAEPAVIVARVVPPAPVDGAGERVGGGRFLPMHLLDVLDGDVIDPAGALPVQALLDRSSAPIVDVRPIHELFPLPTIVADARADAASIAALRSFFDGRSAMRTDKAQATSDERRPETMVLDSHEAPAEALAFETLDFPPLFEETPSFTKLQVAADVERARVAEPLAFVSTSASLSRRPDLRPSISFDIFDPKLDVPVTPSDRATATAATPPAPVDEIQSIVRGRRDPSLEARDQQRPNPLHGTLVALDDSKLEELRGGFETDNGLKISFGIERAVYVNGSLVTTTSLNVADLSRLTAGQAQSIGIDRSTLGIIQSGANNTFTPGQLTSGNVATVVQNTLNDQKIQGITQINATVNSLDMIRRSDVQSRIQSALTDSIRR